MSSPCVQTSVSVSAAPWVISNSRKRTVSTFCQPWQKNNLSTKKTKHLTYNIHSRILCSFLVGHKAVINGVTHRESAHGLCACRVVKQRCAFSAAGSDPVQRRGPHPAEALLGPRHDQPGLGLQGKDHRCCEPTQCRHWNSQGMHLCKVGPFLNYLPLNKCV